MWLWGKVKWWADPVHLLLACLLPIPEYLLVQRCVCLWISVCLIQSKLHFRQCTRLRFGHQEASERMLNLALLNTSVIAARHVKKIGCQAWICWILWHDPYWNLNGCCFDLKMQPELWFQSSLFWMKKQDTDCTSWAGYLKQCRRNVREYIGHPYVYPAVWQLPSWAIGTRSSIWLAQIGNAQPIAIGTQLIASGGCEYAWVLLRWEMDLQMANGVHLSKEWGTRSTGMCAYKPKWLRSHGAQSLSGTRKAMMKRILNSEW